MSYGTIKVKLHETGAFNSQNLVLGNKFLILGGQPNVSVSGIINSVFVVITREIKYDFDVLLFNSPLKTVVENCKSFILLEEDALNCFGKFRVEGNNSGLSDDFLNQVGGNYIAGIYNLNLPFYGKEISGIAIYQDINTNILTDNCHLIINYQFLGNHL